MKIRQIRNATVLLDFGTQKILIDPMLSKKGSLPSLKWVTTNRRKNPIVDLPPETDDVLASVTHVLITHCQKGHFDHLDRAAIKWIRNKRIPVYCSADDSNFLKGLGLDVQVLKVEASNPFLGGEISLVPCQHGIGFVGSLMAHGYGYMIKLPNHPSVYIIGDSILTTIVKDAIQEFRPEIVVMAGGGAQFDLGGEIIMSAEDVLPMLKLVSGTLIVNHLEALDHCPVTREEVKRIGQDHGTGRLLVPGDGEEMELYRNPEPKT